MSLRVEAGGKFVVYWGQCWTKHIPKISKDADLFICESYFYEKPVWFHINYPDVKEHRDEFQLNARSSPYVARNAGDGRQGTRGMRARRVGGGDLEPRGHPSSFTVTLI